MSETGRVLKPANENPWYVLMTLYGEQDGEKVDWNLHEKNRAVWNAWCGQALLGNHKHMHSLPRHIDPAKVSAWQKIATEVMALHRSEMESRNGQSFRYPGFPEAVAMADLSNVHFVRVIDIRAYIFYAVKFDGAVFNEDVCFASTWFYNSVSFTNISSLKKIDFSVTRFRSRCRFDRSIFSGEIKFNRAIFNSSVSFNYCRFDGGANFFNTKFGFTAGFSHSLFLSELRLDKSRFSGNTYFSKSKFSELSSFHGTMFIPNVANPKIGFDECIFEKPTSFESAKFLRCFPSFSRSILHDKTVFSADANFWPKTVQVDPARAKATCAVVRHSFGKQGLPEEEHFFFRREMGFAAQIGGWGQRLPYRVFGAVSDFGYSIQRPALWLFGLWLAVAMINHVVLQWEAIRCGLDYHVVQAFGLSFANQFPVFGLQGRWFSMEFLRDLNPWLKALGGVQTVLSLPLLFFFALGLRTRFRMR